MWGQWQGHQWHLCRIPPDGIDQHATEQTIRHNQRHNTGYQAKLIFNCTEYVIEQVSLQLNRHYTFSAAPVQKHKKWLTTVQNKANTFWTTSHGTNNSLLMAFLLFVQRNMWTWMIIFSSGGVSKKNCFGQMVRRSMKVIWVCCKIASYFTERSCEICSHFVGIRCVEADMLWSGPAIRSFGPKWWSVCTWLQSGRARTELGFARTERILIGHHRFGHDCNPALLLGCLLLYWIREGVKRGSDNSV